MGSRKSGDWSVFDFVFKAPANKVDGVVWAAPSYSIPEIERPSAAVDALAVDLHLLEGQARRMAVMIVEENGSAYEGVVKLDSVCSPGGGTAIVPFSVMSNPSYRKKDDNGKLDIDKIRSVEIAFYGVPNSKASLAFKNLRWVSFGDSDGGDSSHIAISFDDKAH